MLTLAQHRAWCLRPSGDGPSLIVHGGYCVGVIRRSWGLGSIGGSANASFRAVPRAEMRYTAPIDVPEGALCYGLNGQHGQPLTQYGHAWVASVNLLGWTTDYVKFGTFRLAPMSLPNWTHDAEVQWTTWTPYGHLPVGKTQRQRNGSADNFNTTGTVHLANLHYGATNADVKILQAALNRHLGVGIPLTGYYGTMTDGDVRTCQARHLPPADPAGRSYIGPRQAAHLGLRYV